jgi:hypothetical protein
MKKYGDDFSSSSLKRIFTNGELTIIMGKYWDYELLINGSKVTNAVMDIKAGDATITLSETRRQTLFPIDILSYGRVTGNEMEAKLTNYISIDSNIRPSVEVKNDGLKNITTYKIIGAKAGDIFIIKLQAVMMEKLGLNSPEIKVITH